MRLTFIKSLITAALVAIGGAAPVMGQVPTCVAGTSFPSPAIDRNPLIFNTPADLRLAVSSSRIVLTSNDKAQLRCRGTGGKLTGTNTLPLRGADLSSGLFVTSPAIDDVPQFQTRRMFDPRVIYDNHSDKFWIVASEDGTPHQTYDAGRIHIAVSKTATPNSWSGTQWTKCTFGAGADKAPIDIQDFAGPEFDRTFPDRCSIAVDAQFLYICYREAKEFANPVDLWSIILVIAKAQFTSPGAIVPNAILRVDQYMVLELAVDYAIDPAAPAGIFVVSRGLLNPQTNLFEDLRVGTVSLVGGAWTYSPQNYGLGAFKYVGLCSTLNGGEYQSGQGCQTSDVDDNHTNPYFWSCVVRPDFAGVRKIWAVHSVQPTGAICSSPGVLQWYEIPASNPGTFVATRFALPDGDSANDPSIAVNDNSDLVIYFNRSYADTSKYPGIWRLIKPRGQSATISEEKAGPPVVYQGKHYGQGAADIGWADFSGTEPDPVDRCQFWSHHMTAFATPDDPCGTVTQKWQSWLLRTRLSCDSFALRGNLDMNQDGELTDADIEIYNALAADGDPEMDRTYEGETDVWDFMDFMDEWQDPE